MPIHGPQPQTRRARRVACPEFTRLTRPARLDAHEVELREPWIVDPSDLRRPRRGSRRFRPWMSARAARNRMRATVGAAARPKRTQPKT